MRRTLLKALVSVSMLGITVVAPAEMASATFPGQNGRIAYVTVSGDHRVIMSVDASGHDPQLLVDLGEGRDAIDPAWSWDAEQLAFAGEIGEGRFAIFVANGDGSNPVQVTTPDASDTDPSWSPWGDRIAFERESSPAVNLPPQVHILDLATRTTFVLYRGDWVYASADPTWSPDGTMVAIAAPYEIEPYRVAVVRVADQRLLTPPSLAWGGFLYTDLDWTPQGTILTSAAMIGAPEMRVLFEIDPWTGTDTFIGLFEGPLSPSSSPDGRWIVIADAPFYDWTDPPSLGTPKLFAFNRERTEWFEVPAPAEDPAWAPSPGSAPPPPPPPTPDTDPPVITLVLDPPPTDGGVSATSAYVVGAVTDASGVVAASVACVGVHQDTPYWLGPGVLMPIAGGFRFELDVRMEGYTQVRCGADDTLGHSAESILDVYVDDTEPTVGSVTISPSPKRLDQNAEVAAPASDWPVPFEPPFGFEGEIRLSNGRTFPMTYSMGSVRGTIAASVPPGLYDVFVRVEDHAGFTASSPSQPFVVYDPSDSVGGTGYVIPGGVTSESGDRLPGLDGKSKASFSVSVKYRNGATLPTGFFNFSYGKRFKLQSDSLAWLVVPESGKALLQGTASIQGMTGAYPFRVTLWDGGRSDRLVLRVWAPGSEAGGPGAIYQASGEAGGQVQVIG